MSEAKFTPGPWTIPDDQWDDDSPENMKQYIRIADSKEHYDVAYISIGDHQEGDAILVRAAPDMYEALRLVAFHFEEGDIKNTTIVSFDEDGRVAEYRDLHEVVAAALAKATP